MIASFIGEKGSGKSCLVNLILGEEILPHSALSLTSTICEVKYGEQRRIVAHLKDKDTETGLETKSIFLEQQPGSSEQSYIWHAQIYSYASDPAFKKIELFWPHSLLQVVIAENCLAQSNISFWQLQEFMPWVWKDRYSRHLFLCFNMYVNSSKSYSVRYKN